MDDLLPVLRSRVEAALATGSRLFAETEARLAPGDLACRAGCFGCCVGLFEISLPEALLVRRGYAELAPEERDDVLLRARGIVASSAPAFPGDPRSGILDPDRTEEADDRYFEVIADRACPMLELPSGRCRIYPFRPVTCRTYGVAWVTGAELVHPPCGLNLVGAAPERWVETGLDISALDEAPEADAALAEALGLPEGSETTIAHAVVGLAFGG